MKKFIIATLVALSCLTVSYGCEFCGCATGNYYIGFLPQFDHRFVGIRYGFQRFHTSITDNPSEFSHDHYQTVEAWAGFNFGKKWQVITILPYHFIQQTTDDGPSNKNGLGDIAAMVNYKVFDKQSRLANRKMISQQLWFGTGLKLPTGKFDIDATDPELVAIANSQTGTGSADFMLNAMYNVKINKVGLNTSASYKMNTSNNDRYCFGNKFSASTFLYYAIDKFKTGITPNAGLMYENTGNSSLVSQKIANTGGYLVTASAGLEVNLKKITAGANIQLPVDQNFAAGQTTLKARGMAHVSFSF